MVRKTGSEAGSENSIEARLARSRFLAIKDISAEFRECLTDITRPVLIQTCHKLGLKSIGSDYDLYWRITVMARYFIDKGQVFNATYGFLVDEYDLAEMWLQDAEEEEPCYADA